MVEENLFTLKMRRRKLIKGDFWMLKKSKESYLNGSKKMKQ
jgi:hypothetical protein